MHNSTFVYVCFRHRSATRICVYKMRRKLWDYTEFFIQAQNLLRFILFCQQRKEKPNKTRRKRILWKDRSEKKETPHEHEERFWKDPRGTNQKTRKEYSMVCLDQHKTLFSLISVLFIVCVCFFFFSRGSNEQRKKPTLH